MNNEEIKQLNHNLLMATLPSLILALVFYSIIGYFVYKHLKKQEKFQNRKLALIASSIGYTLITSFVIAMAFKYIPIFLHGR